MSKSKAWYYTLPRSFYAFGPVRFDSPISERDFRAYLRKYHKIRRLVGVEVWSTND
jgi:hypothetical protein